jgi:DNA-binding ferritin-like protein
MNLIAPFLRMQNQLRIFHWQTDSYAQHKAFGEAYEDLNDHIDSFIEVFMGKYGKVRAKLTYNIQLENLSDNYLDSIDVFIKFLLALTEDLDPRDTDLLNIRDEMLGTLNKLKYLLTLS